MPDNKHLYRTSARRRYVAWLIAAGVLVGTVAPFGQHVEPSAVAAERHDARQMQAPRAGVLLNDDLSSAPIGSSLEPYLKSDWQATVASDTMGRASVLREDNNRFIRVLYPKGVTGDDGSGARWRTHFRPTDEATAAYRVRFDRGFDWTAGGKLPGLTGGTSPTGGESAAKGFSARYMWKRDGGLELYLYHSARPGHWGEGLDLNQRLEPGRWYTLEQHIKLNTPGKANGVLQVWVNGELELERTDMRWRRPGDSWSIDSFYFNTFHGGSSERYEPDRDNRVDFDNFRVTSGPEVCQTDLEWLSTMTPTEPLVGKPGC